MRGGHHRHTLRTICDELGLRHKLIPLEQAKNLIDWEHDEDVAHMLTKRAAKEAMSSSAGGLATDLVVSVSKVADMGGLTPPTLAEILAQDGRRGAMRWVVEKSLGGHRK